MAASSMNSDKGATCSPYTDMSTPKAGPSQEYHTPTAMLAASPDKYSNTSILESLNLYCMNHIFSWVPVKQLIKTEHVSKKWQQLVNHYLSGVRTFKLSWWTRHYHQMNVGMLSKLLNRIGRSLQKLHLDPCFITFDASIPIVISQSCPMLTELTVVDNNLMIWDHIMQCKRLRKISFISCPRITDASLSFLVNHNSQLECLTVIKNTNVFGSFLNGKNPPNLKYLTFSDCTVMGGSRNIPVFDTIRYLTKLEMNSCNFKLWSKIPDVLKKLPKLTVLSLSNYSTYDEDCKEKEFCEALGVLTDLKSLNLSRNMYIYDTELKIIAKTCTKLEKLDLTACNGRFLNGITDDGLNAVLESCKNLLEINISTVRRITDMGLAPAVNLTQLEVLISQSNKQISTTPFAELLLSCPTLKKMDVRGCCDVTEDLIRVAVDAMEMQPRHTTLWIAGTKACTAVENLPSHRLLTVNRSYKDWSASEDYKNVAMEVDRWSYRGRRY